MDINKILQDRKGRRKETGEDFTPTPLVNEILDRLTIDSNGSVWDKEKTFIDPACGDGQFLVEVLKRKLDKGHNPIKALETIFGCDIMMDNIEICRLRLLKIVSIHTGIDSKEFLACIKIVKRNIECTPLSKYPNGSLDYLGENNKKEIFDTEISDQDAKKHRQAIIDKKLFDQIDQKETQKEIKEQKEVKVKEQKVKETIKEKKPIKESKVVFDEETELNDFLKI
jgi:hypothetical protein